MIYKAVISTIFIIFLTLVSNASYASIFGSTESMGDNIAEFYKWNQVLEKLEGEDSLCKKSVKCVSDEIVNYLSQSKSTLNQLEMVQLVNEYVNNVQYVKDSDGWGKSDYWATPAQFFLKGGDCEDYAIAKFAMLKKAGISSKSMRLVVLEDVRKNIIHSVLVVNIEGKNYLLDNDISKVVTTNQIKHYKPIYSINENNWWRHEVSL